MKLSADLTALQKRIGYRFEQGELLTEAVTHSSMSSASRSDNQRLEFLGDRVLGLVMAEALLGADVKAADYLSSWMRLREIRATYAAATAQFDAVLMPTAPIMPPNVDRLLNDPEYYVTENLLALRNTRVGNLMGLCALTLPTKHPSCGLMVYCNPFEERKLLGLGAEIEPVLT